MNADRDSYSGPQSFCKFQMILFPTTVKRVQDIPNYCSLAIGGCSKPETMSGQTQCER